MVCKLADGTDDKLAGTETVCFIYRGELNLPGMSFYSAKAA